MTNLDSIFKSRDITLPTKVHLVKAMVFPVVTYGCDSWTVKKTEITAFSPIISWKINGETMETVAEFIFGSSKITAVGDYGHEIKRCLLLGRKAMTNLDSILKSRAITLPTKVHLVKAIYSVSSSHHGWMWELDYKKSWAQKNWCFWTVVLEKTLWESLGQQGAPTSPS